TTRRSGLEASNSCSNSLPTRPDAPVSSNTGPPDDISKLLLECELELPCIGVRCGLDLSFRRAPSQSPGKLLSLSSKLPDGRLSNADADHFEWDRPWIHSSS